MQANNKSERFCQLTLYEIVKDSGRYIPSHLIPAICGLASVSLYTRLLTPSDYAKYILVLTTVTFVANIGFGWLNFSALRFFDESRTNLSRFHSTCAISLLLFLMGFVILGPTAIYISNQIRFENVDYIHIILGILLLVSKSVFDQLLVFFRASRMAMKFSIYRTLDALMKLGFSLFFIMLGLSYQGVVWGIIASLAILSFYEIFNGRLYKLIRFKYYSKEIFLRMFKYGYPLIGVAVTGTVLSLADRYMLAYFCSYDEVGIYSAGYRFAEMCIDIPGAILLMAYTPILIQQYNASKGIGFENVMAQPLKLILVVLIPITFGVLFVAEDIVGMFLGEHFVNAQEIFAWISFGVFFSCINQIYTRVFELKNVTKLVLIISGIAASLNIVLNILLIPVFGYVGAAISTTIAYFVQMGCSIILSLKFIKIPIPVYSIFCSIMGSLIMCSAIYISSSLWANLVYVRLGGKICLGGLLYSLSLLILKEPTINSLLKPRAR